MPVVKEILMTADAAGGVWTYSLTLARALAPFGVHVSLALMGPPPSAEQRAQLRELTNVELFESAYKLEWMDHSWDDVRRAGDWLLGLAERIAPDVVHVNGYAHAALPWNAPVVVVAHSSVTDWWRAVKGEEAPAEYDTYRDAMERGMRAADALVSLTRFDALRLSHAAGERAYPAIDVIPNAADSREFAPGNKLPFVFAAGRIWDEAKNVAALDRVASTLSWPVYIAGGARHPNGSMYMPQGAQMLGSVAPQRMREWYARAAIYALPARYEPFGLSVLEAALSGCALVLGDIPTLRENWDGAAIFAPPDDTNALHGALELLIGDDRLRGRLAEKARAVALRFTPERLAQQYMEVYRTHARKAVLSFAGIGLESR